MEYIFQKLISCAISKREKGTAVAEYALVLALVSVTLIGILSQLGDTLVGKITYITNMLGGAQ